MLHAPNESVATGTPPRVKRAPETLELAKFPVDDDDLPAGLPAGAGGGGAGFADDGNFKRGRFGPLSILIGLIVVGLGAGLVYYGFKKEAEKITTEQVATVKKNIYVLPQKDQVPEWRKWAATQASPALQQEALRQLAWAGDEQGVELATKALAQPDHGVRGTAAQVLAHYGTPAADSAKPSLLKALQEADDSDRRQIVWSLVVLKEPQVFQDAMSEYRKGNLSKVQRLGGGAAFDPKLLSQLVSLDEFSGLAGDESGSVRQLVATVLSENAEAKWTDVLIKLVRDADIEVAREAANGLGKIGDEKARAPLLEALAKADSQNREKFLHALRDGIGGEGLVLALDSVSKEKEETTWFQTKQIFEMLDKLADPRVGDALIKWVEASKPLEHWRAEAGTRMAEVGDVRGAKYLGERMRLEPTELYPKEKFWQADAGGHLSRTDRPRVVAARMLADLAVLHPDKADQLKADAEEGVMFWITSRPQPHANGLRFLASVGSEEVKPKMREWAFPKDPLPKEGQQPPFPTAFETAQSALRYIGRMKDDESFDKLLDQFERKEDKKMDITQEGLEGAGLAMLGMALRAVAYGAAQGLGEWGDERAVKPMIEFIEDETWHHEARLAACEALAWCANDETMIEVAKKAAEFAADPKDRKQLIGACYAITLSLRPVPDAVPQLVDLLTPELEPGVAIAIAQAIGMSGFNEESQAKLFSKLENVEIRNAAALALILGGSPDVAARTVAMYADYPKEALNDLKDHYFRAFGYWSDEDFKRGNIYRFVANAEAITRIQVNEVPQDWARQRLQSQFDNLQFDNGPHSETRVVLRHRLYRQAQDGDDAQKKGAIMTLKFMKEKGTLMALRDVEGPTGEMAREAFFELMNPKVVDAEDLSKLQPEKKSGADND